MYSAGARIAILSVAALIVFAVVAALLLHLIPGPRQATDYLVIGTLATLATLASLFAAIITGWLKSRDIFYRRRAKPGS